MRALFLFAVSLIIAGCAATGASQERAQWQPTAELVEIDQEAMNAAMESIREKLKDPESARFSRMYGTTKPGAQGGPVVCGYVNAKNSYGGYTGDVLFASWGDIAILQEARQRGRMSVSNELLKDLCVVKEA